ncbi:MAG: hypothetical protein NTZ05_22920 [Chloroflexi bacterium]|nr:hypothetical protein [Chloroflexota bacterium]
MQKCIRWLVAQADALVALTVGAMTIAGVLINGFAFYAAAQPPDRVVPPLFQAPERFIGQANAPIEAVIVRRFSPGVMEVVPLTGGMWQDDPRLLVALGPGAAPARLRSEGQDVFLAGVVLQGRESVPPGTTLTPEAEQLLDEGWLFFYAERI